MHRVLISWRSSTPRPHRLGPPNFQNNVMIHKHAYASESHLCNLSYEALERELAKEWLRGLLILSNLAESNSTRAIAMRPLYSRCCCGPLCRRNLVRDGLFTVVLTCSLLRARHKAREQI